MSGAGSSLGTAARRNEAAGEGWQGAALQRCHGNGASRAPASSARALATWQRRSDAAPQGQLFARDKQWLRIVSWLKKMQRFLLLQLYKQLIL